MESTRTSHQLQAAFHRRFYFSFLAPNSKTFLPLSLQFTTWFLPVQTTSRRAWLWFKAYKRKCEKWTRVVGTRIACLWTSRKWSIHPASPLTQTEPSVIVAFYRDGLRQKQGTWQQRHSFLLQSAASLKPLRVEWPQTRCAKSWQLGVSHQGYSLEFPEFVPFSVRRTFPLSAPTVIHLHWWI